MNVTLIGFMGTGKTAVGKRLAKRLGWAFVDVDQLIEARAKMPVVKIFATRGEAVFRRLERRCIAQLVHGKDQVIATGGGAFLDQESRGKLRASGPVICLAATPKVLLARLERQIATRPLLHGMGSPLSRIQELLAQRAPLYAQADLTIDTSALTAEEVADRVWQHLSPLLCKSWRYVRDHMSDLGKRYGAGSAGGLPQGRGACTGGDDARGSAGRKGSRRRRRGRRSRDRAAPLRKLGGQMDGRRGHVRHNHDRRARQIQARDAIGPRHQGHL